MLSSVRILPRNRKQDPRVQETQTWVGNNKLQRSWIIKWDPSYLLCWVGEWSGLSLQAQHLAPGRLTKGQPAWSCILPESRGGVHQSAMRLWNVSFKGPSLRWASSKALYRILFFFPREDPRPPIVIASKSAKLGLSFTEDWVLKSDDKIEIYKCIPHISCAKCQEHKGEEKDGSGYLDVWKEGMNRGCLTVEQGFEDWKLRGVKEMMQGQEGRGVSRWGSILYLSKYPHSVLSVFTDDG